MKTNELSGVALDYAVALCETENIYTPNPYSTDWAHGGPIIQRSKITVICAEGDYNPQKSGTPDCYDIFWVAEIGRLTPCNIYGPQTDDWGRHFLIDECATQGPTPLVAAMRCYVASKLGDDVKIPAELLETA